METQKLILTYLEKSFQIISTKTKLTNLLVSVILLFVNEYYKKTNKSEKNTTNTNKNKWEMKLNAPTLPKRLLIV